MSRRRRVLLLAAALLLLAGLARDLGRAPDEQLSARALLAGIRVYRQQMSPRLARTGIECRFFPSCSRYAEVSIRRHGALVGVARAVARIARCGPWSVRGTIDPP